MMERASAKSNENHEPPFSVLRWLEVADVGRMQSVGWGVLHSSLQRYQPLTLRSYIMWTKPEFTEMRFGFEVTMYIANR